jgi:hypothetical protein
MKSKRTAPIELHDFQTAIFYSCQYSKNAKFLLEGAAAF